MKSYKAHQYFRLPYDEERQAEEGVAEARRLEMGLNRTKLAAKRNLGVVRCGHANYNNVLGAALLSSVNAVDCQLCAVDMAWRVDENLNDSRKNEKQPQEDNKKLTHRISAMSVE